jgi:hypothetical protein
MLVRHRLPRHADANQKRPKQQQRREEKPAAGSGHVRSLAGRRCGRLIVTDRHHGHGTAGHGRGAALAIAGRARAQVIIGRQTALLRRIRRAGRATRTGQAGADRAGGGALTESQRRIGLAGVSVASAQVRVAATDPLFAAMNSDRGSAAGPQIIGLLLAAGAQASRRRRAARDRSRHRRRLPVGRVTGHRAGNATGSRRNERQPEGTTEERTDDSLTENRASSLHRREYNDLVLSSNEHRRAIRRFVVWSAQFQAARQFTSRASNRPRTTYRGRAGGVCHCVVHRVSGQLIAMPRCLPPITVASQGHEC